MEKVGILTGGGDCPGLNAVIRAVVRRAHGLGYDVLGVKNGWAGLIHGYTEPLTDFSVTGILPRGGTILGTSRTNPFRDMDHIQKLKSNWQKFGLNYLVAVGGEDTLGVAHKLFRQEGYPVVGVPKTIDNDLAGTDYTFGFDTAVQIVTEAIDRLHTTAESHKRVMVVEAALQCQGEVGDLGAHPAQGQSGQDRGSAFPVDESVDHRSTRDGADRGGHRVQFNSRVLEHSTQPLYL